MNNIVMIVVMNNIVMIVIIIYSCIATLRESGILFKNLYV